MTFYLITSLIVTVTIRRISATITNEGTIDLTAQESNGYGNMMTASGEGQNGIDESTFDTFLDDPTLNMTSEDRVSYYSKRGAPYPHRFAHHHHHSPYSHHHHPRHPGRPRKKKRGRRKPKPPFMKMPFKRPQKPILLSEMLRNMGPHSQFPGPGPGNIIKSPPSDYFIEDDEFDGNPPFGTIDAVDSLPPGVIKYGRPPQSFEITDDGPDIIPIAPIEEGIVYPPGISNLKPFSSVIRRPPGPIWASSKPSEDIYFDEEPPDSIRNIRNGPPSYAEKDILSLLQKLKYESDSKGQSSDNYLQSSSNATELNAAISKVLFPLLSENAVKQIQLYFNSLPNEKQHNVADRNVTKVVYVLENQRDKKNRTKQYSVTEPLQDEENSTYFIMIKSPNNKPYNATKLLSLSTQKHNSLRGHDHQNPTPPTKESLALQKYIMMLAGLSKDTTDNYLPRFSSIQNKQAKDVPQKKSDVAAKEASIVNKEAKEVKGTKTEAKNEKKT